MMRTYRPERTAKRLGKVDRTLRGYWAHYWRFLTFCAIAGVGVLIQSLLMFALTRWGLHYIAAAVSSSIVALLCAYSACRKRILR